MRRWECVSLFVLLGGLVVFFSFFFRGVLKVADMAVVIFGTYEMSKQKPRSSKTAATKAENKNLISHPNGITPGQPPNDPLGLFPSLGKGLTHSSKEKPCIHSHA